MVNIRYTNAMKEVLFYLKGIREEDVNKIPKNFIEFLEENASTDYECEIDYTRPLSELNVMNETKGILGWICYTYWCDTAEQKKTFFNKLIENENSFQEELNKIYNVDNLFKNAKNNKICEECNINEEKSLIIVQETKIEKIYKKIIIFFKSLISKKL